MDFHSLKRRDLQALCKKNKIPANLTNVAMADALTALDTVEGIEEFLNQPSVESPEKAVKASPCVPRTGGRTTTRKKPIKEEAESVQISTRARRGTRKATVEGGTPRNQKEEVSVQKMHSRRSTRLLEKKMNELNLNDEDRIKAIDFGGSDEEMANEIDGNLKKHSDDLVEVLEDKGLNQETTSVDLLKKNDALGYLLDKKSDDLSEIAKELGQSSEVLDQSDIVLVSEENTFALTPDLGEDDDHAKKDQNEDNNGVDSEGSAESDILSGESLDKSQEVKDNATEKEGLNQDTKKSEDFLKTDDLEDLVDEKSDNWSENARELEQPSEVLDESGIALVSEGNTYMFTPEVGEDDDEVTVAGLNQDTKKSEDFLKTDDMKDLVDEKSDNLSENARELEQPSEVLDESGIALVSEGNTYKFTPEVGEDDDEVNDTIKGLNQDTKKSDDFLKTDDLEDLVDEKSDNLSKDARELEQPSEVPDESDQNAESDLLSGENLEKSLDFKDDAPEKDDIIDPIDDLVSEDSSQVEVDTLNVSLSVATEDQKQDVELQNQAVVESDVFSAKDLEDEFDHTGQMNEESDLVIGSSIKIDCISIELSGAIECPPVTDSQMSSCSIDNLMAVDQTKFSFPSDKTSNAELPVEMVSTLAADPLAEQMPLLQSNSDLVICSASVTPRKKLSCKTPTTTRKISILSDENKENIDNSGIKLDLPKEKGMKEDPLNDKSLRQLSKMLKEQMQITSKKNILEENDIPKVGKARPALQSLPENSFSCN